MSNLRFPLSDVGAFIDQRIPTYPVNTSQALSGKRVSSTWALSPLTTYVLKQNILRSNIKAEYQRWVGIFSRLFGGLDSCLLEDPEDKSVTDHGFAVGDGITTAFQLQRATLGTYEDSLGTTYGTATKPYTNLLKNSGFETDTNADGLADNWTVYNNSTATEPAQSLIVPGVNGGKAQRVSWGTNNASTKGLLVNTGQISYLTGQWYTLTFAARASGTNVGKFMSTAWNNGPTSEIALANPPLSTSWQRYGAQFFWNPGAATPTNLWLTICNTALATFLSSVVAPTFGTLDFDQVQLVAGQWGVNDLAPIETPASSTLTDNPAYWPGFTDGFLPVYELNGDATIFQDGDWLGRRQLYPYPRTNILPNSSTLDAAGWTKNSTTITANATTAPDGTATADQISEGTANAVHSVVQNTSPAETQGELRCYSTWLKAGTLPNVMWRVQASDVGVNFNLGTGVIDSLRTSAQVLASGVITSPLWPGSFRVWFIERVSSTLGTGAVIQAAADATYTNGAYLGTSRTFIAWGAMVERVSDLSGPTPYIPTPSTTAVTVTDYSQGTLGVVTLTTALPTGAFLSWTGNYFIRVRLVDSTLPLQRVVLQLWSTGLQLISVKP